MADGIAACWVADGIAVGWIADGAAVRIVVVVQKEKEEEHTLSFHKRHGERVLHLQHIGQCSHA